MRVGRDIVTTGNTSSASIPIALDRMRAAGEVHSGDLVLAVGFGAGLTYAGQVLTDARDAARAGTRDAPAVVRPTGRATAECARVSPASQPVRRDHPTKGTSVSNDDILAGLGEIVEEVAGVPAADVTADKSFTDDLDIDSLSMVEIAVQAEDKFGVKIPDDELANLKTVGDAVVLHRTQQGLT